MTSFRDILAPTAYISRLSTIAREAEEKHLRNLGKNDAQHSKAIERLLDRMVPANIKSNQDLFSEGEIFLLLVAVYLHDIGRKTHPKAHETATYWRLVKNPAEFHLDEREAEAVAHICIAHADETVWKIDNCPAKYGLASAAYPYSRPHKLRPLGALLRVADEFEHSWQRVQGIPAEAHSARNLIDDVHPDLDKHTIEIFATAPDKKAEEELENIRARTQTRLDQVASCLQELGLAYSRVLLNTTHRGPRPPLVEFVEPADGATPRHHPTTELLPSLKGFSEFAIKNEVTFQKITISELRGTDLLRTAPHERLQACVQEHAIAKHLGKRWITLNEDLLNAPHQLLFASEASIRNLDQLPETLSIACPSVCIGPAACLLFFTRFLREAFNLDSHLRFDACQAVEFIRRVHKGATPAPHVIVGGDGLIVEALRSAHPRYFPISASTALDLVLVTPRRRRKGGVRMTSGVIALPDHDVNASSLANDAALKALLPENKFPRQTKQHPEMLLMLKENAASDLAVYTYRPHAEFAKLMQLGSELAIVNTPPQQASNTTNLHLRAQKSVGVLVVREDVFRQPNLRNAILVGFLAAYRELRCSEATAKTCVSGLIRNPNFIEGLCNTLGFPNLSRDY